MKRSYIILLVISVFLAGAPQEAAAQERAVDSLFTRYTRAEGYTSVIYGKKMLEMMKDGASTGLQALLDGIEVIRIISCRDAQHSTLASEAAEAAENGHYELVSQVNRDGSSSAFYFKDDPCGKSSFLMVSVSDGKEAVLDIYGVFDIKDISRLSAIPADTR